jgi:putative Mg2+ transporter-C (MgtC) family protein
VQTLYRLRVICEGEHRAEVEGQVTRAIAERSLVLRHLATEEIEETATTLVQARSSRARETGHCSMNWLRN